MSQSSPNHPCTTSCPVYSNTFKFLLNTLGKVVFKNREIHNNVINADLAPVRYVDDDGRVTSTYPLNPNGSPDGIAAVCSQDGRHLAIMPHPERCFLSWQCPWMPYEWRKEKKPSPWSRMFQNAYVWCAGS